MRDERAEEFHGDAPSPAMAAAMELTGEGEVLERRATAAFMRAPIQINMLAASLDGNPAMLSRL